jgi:hypothetical protein
MTVRKEGVRNRGNEAGRKRDREEERQCDRETVCVCVWALARVYVCAYVRACARDSVRA